MNAPTLILLLTLSTATYLDAQEVDALFGAQIEGTVHAITMTTSGQIVVGGEFERVNNIPRANLVWLHSDGSVDATFDAAPDAGVFCLASGADGSIYAGGAFNAPARHLFRMLPTGQFDLAFEPGASASSRIECLALAPDGAIFPGGPFRRFDNSPANYIAKITSSGALDATFASGLSPNFAMEAGATAVALQADAKVLLAGNVAVENDFAYLIRLNADGSIDSSFSGDHGPMLYPKCIIVLEDGKILVAGTNPDGQGFLRKLKSDRSVDETFSAPSFDSPVEAMAVDQDGRIIIGGNFNAKLARLNPDGSFDQTWTITADGSVKSLVTTDNGDILVGGAFSRIGGRDQRGLARIKMNRLQTFATNANGRFVARLRGEPGRTYKIEFSTDLRAWSEHSTTIATESGIGITDETVARKHRFYRARLID